MAQKNCNGYANGGNGNGQSRMMNAHVMQSEGERLVDQALSFYALKDFTQVEILINKAIALEPSNEALQEIRNSLLHASPQPHTQSQWPSTQSQRPSTQSQRPPAGGRCNFQGVQSQRQQLARDPTAANCPRATWEYRNAEGQGGANYSNGNRPQNGGSSWQSSVNTSNSVADNMFGSSSWQGSAGSVPNQDPQTNSGFSDRKHSYSAPGSNVGSQHGQANNTGKKDNEWSEWTDSGATCNSSMKPPLLDSGGFRQRDIFRTGESRNVPSVSNHSKSGVNCSRSQQGSAKGSMANSAERSSMKGPCNRVGRRSPQTWQSEETSSETMHALDTFDVSSKVQEWLNKTDSSETAIPSGLVKSKKNRKKKKKTAAAKSQTKAVESKEVTDHHLAKGSKTSWQGKENKKVEKINSQEHTQFSKQKTVPGSTKPATSTTHVSGKLSQPQTSSIKTDDQPTESKREKVVEKSFFDPRRIFNSSEKRGPVEVDSKRTDEDHHYTKRLPCSWDIEARIGNSTSPTLKGETIPTRDNDQGKVSSKKTETPDSDKEPEQGRQSSPERSYSESDERMTEAEWREIIKRMYVPLGISPDTSPEKSDKIESPEKVRANSSSCQQSSVHLNPDTVASNASSVSRTEGSLGKNTSSSVNAEKTNANRKGECNPSAEKYVNVKSRLNAGILETDTPVCHANPNMTANAPPKDSCRGYLGGDTVTSKSYVQPMCSPSCQESLTKPSTESTHGQSSPSGGKINCLSPTKPVSEPKIAISSAPSTESVKATAIKRETTVKGCVGSKETKPSHIIREQATQAKKSTKQPTKAFWEPSRIFSVPGQVGGHKKTAVDVNDSCINPGKPATNSTAHTKTSLASSKTGSCKVNPESSIHLKPSGPSNIAGNSQTKDVPPNPKVQFTYTDWKKQNASAKTDSNTHTAAAAEWEPIYGSKTKSTAKQSAGGAATRNLSPTNDPKVTSETVKGTIPKMPSGDASASRESKQPTSPTSPTSTQKTPSSTDARGCFNPSSYKTRTSNHSPGFDQKRENPTRAAPNQSDGNQGAPPREESRTKSKSGTGQESRRRQTQTNSTRSGPGKHSANTNSKAPGENTTQGSRPKSSAGNRTESQASGARESSWMRDDEAAPRQRNNQEEEINIEDVDPLYKWMRVIGKHLLWVLAFILFLSLILFACLCSTIKFCVKYGWHILKEIIKLLQEHREREGASTGQDGGTGGQRSRGSSNGPSNPQPPLQPTRSVEIPTSAGAAIKRLLHCNHDNPFEVLGVSSDASIEDIKKNYRRQCMLVHPDKNEDPRAQEAFQILQKGYDTLTDPVKRREFEMEKRNVNFSEEMEDFVKKMEEILNTLSCDACLGKHRRYETDRSQQNARYCGTHGERHIAFEGDMWAETSHFGFKVHFFAMMEDRVFDITEWAACQKSHGHMGHIETNGCEIRYRLGSRNTRGSSRSRNQQQSNAHSFSNHHSHQRSQDQGPEMSEEQLRDLFERLHMNESGPGGDRYNNAGQDRNKKHKKHRKKKR